MSPELSPNSPTTPTAIEPPSKGQKSAPGEKEDDHLEPALEKNEPESLHPNPLESYVFHYRDLYVQSAQPFVYCPSDVHHILGRCLAPGISLDLAEQRRDLILKGAIAVTSIEARKQMVLAIQEALKKDFYEQPQFAHYKLPTKGASQMEKGHLEKD